MIHVIQIEGDQVFIGFRAMQVIHMIREIQARRNHAKNSNPAGSADAGDLGDLDLADSMDSGESDPGLKGFMRFRPGGLMGFRGVSGFLIPIDFTHMFDTQA